MRSEAARARHREKMRVRYYIKREDILRARHEYYVANGEKIRAYSRQRRADNVNEIRAYDRARGPKRSALGRAFADAAMAGGCVDCGTKEQVVLDLDHVRGKKVGNVSAMLAGPLHRLLAEIDKCETRCANCHRRVTAQRRRAA